MSEPSLTEFLLARITALADDLDKQAGWFRIAEPVHFRSHAEQAERVSRDLRALAATLENR